MWSDGWSAGTVVQQWYREDSMPAERWCAYQVAIPTDESSETSGPSMHPEGVRLIMVPQDTDIYCRRNKSMDPTTESKAATAGRDALAQLKKLGYIVDASKGSGAVVRSTSDKAASDDLPSPTSVEAQAKTKRLKELRAAGQFNKDSTWLEWSSVEGSYYSICSADSKPDQMWAHTLVFPEEGVKNTTHVTCEAGSAFATNFCRANRLDELRSNDQVGFFPSFLIKMHEKGAISAFSIENR